ncbi:MAG: inositol-3-phosphate synthase, partial [Nitrospinaceae bacterium]
MKKVKTVLVGVGNCASSLVQGIDYYRNRNGSKPNGLMHAEIGGYAPSDIQVVAAFDIDRRKVGRDLLEAIFAEPNCTTAVNPVNHTSGGTVQMGRVLDGISSHMGDY